MSSTVRESAMRNGPEGRDPCLSADVEHWSVRIETDWPVGGMRACPEMPPWTVEARVKFTTREAAARFEHRLMELLHE
jgi:hypothetical protein